MASAIDASSIDYVRVKLEFIKKLKEKLHVSIDENFNKVESLATAWMGKERKSVKGFQIMSMTLENFIIFLTGSVQQFKTSPDFAQNLLAQIAQAEEIDSTEADQVANTFTESKMVENELEDLHQPANQRLSLEKEISALATALSLKDPNATSRLNFLLNYELGKYPQMRDMVLEMADKEDALSFFGFKNSVPVEESQTTERDKDGDGQTSESPATSSQGQVCKCDHVLESIQTQQLTLQKDLVNLFKHQNDLENQLSQIKDLDKKFTERLSSQDAKLQTLASNTSPRPDTDVSTKIRDCVKEIEIMKRNTHKNYEMYRKKIIDVESQVTSINESQSKCNQVLKTISQKQSSCDSQISMLLEKVAYSERRLEDRQKEFDNALKSHSVKQSSLEKKIDSVASVHSKLGTDLNAQHDSLKDDLEKLGKRFQGVIKRMDTQTRVNLESQKLIEDFTREMTICKSHIDSLLGKPVPSNLADRVEEISKQQKCIQQKEETTVMTLTDLIQQYSNLEQSFVTLTSRVDALKKTMDNSAQISLSGFTKFSVRLNQTEQMIRTIKRALEKKLQKQEQTQVTLTSNISDLISRTDSLTKSAVDQATMHRDLSGCINHVLKNSEATENQLISMTDKVNIHCKDVAELRQTQVSHAGRFERVESFLTRLSEGMSCFAEPLGGENVPCRDDLQSASRVIYDFIDGAQHIKKGEEKDQGGKEGEQDKAGKDEQHKDGKEVEQDEAGKDGEQDKDGKEDEQDKAGKEDEQHQTGKEGEQDKAVKEDEQDKAGKSEQLKDDKEVEQDEVGKDGEQDKDGKEGKQDEDGKDEQDKAGKDEQDKDGEDEQDKAGEDEQDKAGEDEQDKAFKDKQEQAVKEGEQEPAVKEGEQDKACKDEQDKAGKEDEEEQAGKEGEQKQNQTK